jgi:hypothetical protein
MNDPAQRHFEVLSLGIAMKTRIIEQLGQTDILMPALISEGLAANDRVKVRLTALQAMACHAQDSSKPAGRPRVRGGGDSMMHILDEMEGGEPSATTLTARVPASQCKERNMMRREFEIKLDVPPTSLPALENIPLMRTLKQARKQAIEVSVYFDTDKQKLRRNGLILRVRRVGKRYIQTMKATRDSGLLERDEWENEIAGETPDLSLASRTALEPLVNDELRRQLKPRFETRVRRTVYPVTDKDCAMALTIDRGTIDTGTRSVLLCEIELEFEHGTIARLFDVARKLTHALPT